MVSKGGGAGGEEDGCTHNATREHGCEVGNVVPDGTRERKEKERRTEARGYRKRVGEKKPISRERKEEILYHVLNRMGGHGPRRGVGEPICPWPPGLKLVCIAAARAVCLLDPWHARARLWLDAAPADGRSRVSARRERSDRG